LIIVDSFRAPAGKIPGGFGLDAWKLAFADPALLAAIWNTLTITVARHAIALPIAAMLAWIIARTDVPAGKTIEFLFWLGYFLPPLPVTMGWILLLDPDFGLLNQWAMQWTFIRQAPFNIYSFWGIVWAHLTTSTIAVEVMLLTPAFRNMDATLEEASLASGASILRTLRRIVVPLMTPIVGVVLLLGIVHSLQAFEVELILGFPFRFYVFSTQIHWLLQQQPPQFAAATALGSTILFIMTPFVIWQRRLTDRRNFATVGSRYQGLRVIEDGVKEGERVVVSGLQRVQVRRGSRCDLGPVRVHTVVAHVANTVGDPFYLMLKAGGHVAEGRRRSERPRDRE
jgi:iron(III) transport system permease protein